jgi:hypothetical protein
MFSTILERYYFMGSNTMRTLAIHIKPFFQEFRFGKAIPTWFSSKEEEPS